MTPEKVESTTGTGRSGEGIARSHLEQQGFEIVETNYRYGHEEIDIIARDGDVLVFCEVKTRRSDRFGEPEYAVTKRKQQSIRRAATGYLLEHEIDQQVCRFDVVAIDYRHGVPEIRHLRNAFP